jgi:hypothetical protein
MYVSNNSRLHLAALPMMALVLAARPNYWMELITTRVFLLPRVTTDSMVNPFSGQYQSVTCAVPDLAALPFPAGAPLRLPLDVVAV